MSRHYAVNNQPLTAGEFGALVSDLLSMEWRLLPPADPTGEQIRTALSRQADRQAIERAHRRQWADYIESCQAAVGPHSPTVEGIIAALRADEPPFGVGAA